MRMEFDSLICGTGRWPWANWKYN